MTLESNILFSSEIENKNEAPELTVVVPTFNERGNVPILIDRLRTVLQGIHWEVLFVDDNSPDNTAQLIREIGQNDNRIRCIRRVGRRGLAGACLEGILASHAKYVAIMDGDLQHDETKLLPMLEQLSSGKIDIVVATRYSAGGDAKNFSILRSCVSRYSNFIAYQFLGVKLSDPMSGFFMVRQEIVDNIAPSLSTQGFKILLDIITTSKGNLCIAEIPFSFGKREYGESKLSTRVALDFVSLVIDKLTKGTISTRFLLFNFVGLIGLCMHMALLNIGLINGLKFNIAQLLSTVLVIASNFTLNNALTYRDQQLKGKHFLAGLIRFEIICSMGLISNVGIASWIYNQGERWWLAGLSGAIIGSVWNYMVSRAFVWRDHSPMT